MTYLFLVLDLEGRKKFDFARVRSCIQEIAGTYNWQEESYGERLWCQFDSKGDSTDVSLSADLYAITLSGIGYASLALALQIQGCYAEEIYAVDDEQVFQLALSQILSLEEFQQKITAAYNAIQEE